MLLSLHIENVAVIKNIDIDFSAGFTALTGETGAGKSVIIESIKLLFGAKAERELIRSSADFAMVSGCFSDMSPSAVAMLAEEGIYPDEEGNVLIQRTVTRDGRSQSKINGRTVTLSILKNCALALMSIHGQSDTAMLTAASNHIELLDTYADNKELLNSYGEIYEKLLKVRERISDITDKAAESERLREMLLYQIKDIDSAALHSGEEEELVDKKVKIRNSEKVCLSGTDLFSYGKGSAHIYKVEFGTNGGISCSSTLRNFAKRTSSIPAADAGSGISAIIRLTRTAGKSARFM